MFTLIGLGVLSAWVYSTLVVVVPDLLPHSGGHGHAPVYFESAAVITVLVILGQLLESRARRATGSAIESLMKLAPQTAHLVEGSVEKEIPLDAVKPGDVLRIKPGGKIPVDGLVLEGVSTIDESMLTGEPMPVMKKADSRVTSGTVNGNGTLLMKAERVGADTLLSQIIALTAQAQRSRAPVQRQADRVSGWFVPVVVLIAMVTFLVWWEFGPQPSLGFAIVNAVAVLIIACPCALGLATPMAVTTGMGRGAQLGVLIKDAETLERLGTIDTIMLDKTGTLTEGKPSVVEVHPLPGLSARDLLACAAAVETASEHPLAAAIVAAAKERNIPLATVKDFQAVPGGGVLGTVGETEVFVGQAAFLKKKGVFIDTECATRSAELQASGFTVVLVVLDGRPLGLIALTDKIKESTKPAINALHALGLKFKMLTGDTRSTADRVAKDLRIDEVAAELSPHDKLVHVYQMKEQGRKAAYVGDGINDAPALSGAEVGIAMGTGTDAAMHSASVTLVKGDLRALHRAFTLSRATLRIIRQNLAFSFLYNAIGILIAAGVLYPFTGRLLSPMLASVAMSLSSLTVILNSLRLRWFK
jgi:Cu+-exporting ATPase